MAFNYSFNGLYGPRPEELTGNICVFAAARPAAEPYVEDAIRMGELIGESGYDLVYGGTPAGLMGAVSSAARKNGSKVTGVYPGRVNLRSQAELDYDEFDMFDDFGALGTLRGFGNKDAVVGAGSLEERKHRMLHMSDAVIALAGGIGTLDEIVTTIERDRGMALRGAASRFVILNTNNFYGGFREHLDTMHREKLTSVPAAGIAHFAETPEKAMEYIERKLSFTRRVNAAIESRKDVKPEPHKNPVSNPLQIQPHKKSV